MKYLLDTHTLIWTIIEKQKLSDVARKILEDSSNSIFVSAISFWEISLKFSLRKLDLQGVSPDEFPELVSQMEFDIMPLEASEAATYHRLITAYHRDPFDRMLIWQAIKSDSTLISKDKNMSFYRSEGLKLLW